MSTNFGMNKREAVAIMGGHTMGGATGPTGSGFNGFWKGGNDYVNTLSMGKILSPLVFLSAFSPKNLH